MRATGAPNLASPEFRALRDGRTFCFLLQNKTERKEKLQPWRSTGFRDSMEPHSQAKAGRKVGGPGAGVSSSIPAMNPYFQHSTVASAAEVRGWKRKISHPWLGWPSLGWDVEAQALVLSSLSLKSEGNQRWGDDSDSRLSKDAGRKTALSRSPACGQQSALMMPYSLSHCQG